VQAQISTSCYNCSRREPRFWPLLGIHQRLQTKGIDLTFRYLSGVSFHLIQNLSIIPTSISISLIYAF